MAGKTSTLLLDDDLSAGRDTHVHVLLLLSAEISDLAGWQVSLVMLIGSGLNLIAVYVASQIW